MRRVGEVKRKSKANGKGLGKKENGGRKEKRGIKD